MAADWDSLTAAQQSTILNSTNPQIDTGVEWLNFDLSVNKDISDSVSVTSGDVQWQGGQVVNRDCVLDLSMALPWGAALVRIYRLLTDRVTGLSARSDRGVFLLSTPDRVLGTTVRDANGVQQIMYSNVAGQDRAALLDRLPGYSVVEPMLDGGGAQRTVGQALASLYAAAGLPGYLIDSSGAGSPLPRDLVWPMIAAGNGSSVSSVDLQNTTLDPLITGNADQGWGATWRQMINDVHSLVSYRAVWCDQHGYLRSTPFGRPDLQPATVTLDADSPTTPLGVTRTLTTDPWGIPNRWVFTWSNMPPLAGAQQNPTLANGGVYVVNNVSDGLSSQDARNHLVYSQTYALTAATVADFTAQGDAKVAADKRIVTKYQFTLHPIYAVLGHFTIAQLSGHDLPGGGVKVRLTSWQESLSNADITVTAESVT